jgi:hypothetical protein
VDSTLAPGVQSDGRAAGRAMHRQKTLDNEGWKR